MLQNSIRDANKNKLFPSGLRHSGSLKLEISDPYDREEEGFLGFAVGLNIFSNKYWFIDNDCLSIK